MLPQILRKRPRERIRDRDRDRDRDRLRPLTVYEHGHVDAYDYDCILLNEEISPSPRAGQTRGE